MPCTHTPTHIAQRVTQHTSSDGGAAVNKQQIRTELSAKRSVTTHIRGGVHLLGQGLREITSTHDYDMPYHPNISVFFTHFFKLIISSPKIETLNRLVK